MAARICGGREERDDSVPDYLVIETAFTAVHWAIVGPLTALAFAPARRVKGCNVRRPRDLHVLLVAMEMDHLALRVW